MVGRARLTNYAQISPADLKHALDGGAPLIAPDVRDRAAYARAHIPQAKNIPYDELEARALDELPHAGLIVMYCECVEDNMSKNGYDTLTELGFSNLRILTNGVHGWMQAGLPIDTVH